jgi:transformation/transcription domain-associated protein
MNMTCFKTNENVLGEFGATRPVPFRLTPNIVEYLSSIGISGPLTASMIATARCFVYPNFKVQAILKPILRDEMVLSRMKKPEEAVGNNMEKLTDSEQIINMVNKAVTSISNRLNSLAHFDGTDSKVSVGVEKSKLVSLTVLKKNHVGGQVLCYWLREKQKQKCRSNFGFSKSGWNLFQCK